MLFSLRLIGTLETGHRIEVEDFNIARPCLFGHAGIQSEPFGDGFFMELVNNV